MYGGQFVSGTLGNPSFEAQLETSVQWVTQYLSPVLKNSLAMKVTSVSTAEITNVWYCTPMYIRASILHLLKDILLPSLFTYLKKNLTNSSRIASSVPGNIPFRLSLANVTESALATDKLII